MTATVELTDRQSGILAYIRQEIERRGIPPTFREIQEAFDIRSPNGVMCHLRALEKKGCISRVGFKARSIVLPGASPDRMRRALELTRRWVSGFRCECEPQENFECQRCGHLRIVEEALA